MHAAYAKCAIQYAKYAAQSTSINARVVIFIFCISSTFKIKDIQKIQT
jgi:hypothetical protein